MTTQWKTLRQETMKDGRIVELRYAEFGKGRAKLRSWKIFRDDVQVGYAVNATDADTNFGRVTAGFTLDTETGNYVATGRQELK